MKAPTNLVKGGIAVMALSAILFSCQKENSGSENIPDGMNRLSVYITDGPADFQQVLVDIQSIDVKIDTCRRNSDDDHHGHPGCDDDNDSLYNQCQVWQSLNINPGVYDLLTLSNGVDTLLASGFLLQGKIERIKVTLGTNNSVLVDSVTYPLNLVGGRDYVYVNIRREHLDSLSSNNFQLFLDFDLGRSIVYHNGQYWLKPVLHPFGNHATGEIKGKVRPSGSFRLISAANSSDTGYARPTPRHHNGEFTIRGLDTGTYDLFIEGANGYRDTTITNVQVERRRKTDVGNIEMQQ